MRPKYLATSFYTPSPQYGGKGFALGATASAWKSGSRYGPISGAFALGATASAQGVFALPPETRGGRKELLSGYIGAATLQWTISKPANQGKVTLCDNAPGWTSTVRHPGTFTVMHKRMSKVIPWLPVLIGAE